MKMKIVLWLILVLFPVIAVSAEGECVSEDSDVGVDKSAALKYKIVAIATILTAGGAGVCLPFLSSSVPALRPESDLFVLVKSFAAGVILSTGFIHVFPDAFESLTSPCLGENPWGSFPFASLVAMLSAIGTLMVDAFATSYFRRREGKKATSTSGSGGEEQVASGHSHAHPYEKMSDGTDLIRHRIVSQVQR